MSAGLYEVISVNACLRERDIKKILSVEKILGPFEQKENNVSCLPKLFTHTTLDNKELIKSP